MKAQIDNIVQNAKTLARFIDAHPECEERLVASINCAEGPHPTIIFISQKEHVMPILGHDGWVRKFSTSGFGFFDWVKVLDGVLLVLPFAEAVILNTYESDIHPSSLLTENSAVAVEASLSTSAIQ